MENDGKSVVGYVEYVCEEETLVYTYIILGIKKKHALDTTLGRFKFVEVFPGRTLILKWHASANEMEFRCKDRTVYSETDTNRWILIKEENKCMIQMNSFKIRNEWMLRKIFPSSLYIGAVAFFEVRIIGGRFCSGAFSTVICHSVFLIFCNLAALDAILGFFCRNLTSTFAFLIAWTKGVFCIK